MNILKNVVNRIAESDKKTEVNLASEKIELSNIEFVESIVKEGKDIYKKAVKFESEINSFTKKARFHFDHAKALEDGGIKILNDFEKAVKDLGLNPNNLPQYKEAIRIIGDMNSVKTRLEPFAKLK